MVNEGLERKDWKEGKKGREPTRRIQSQEQRRKKRLKKRESNEMSGKDVNAV